MIIMNGRYLCQQFPDDEVFPVYDYDKILEYEGITGFIMFELMPKAYKLKQKNP